MIREDVLYGMNVARAAMDDHPRRRVDWHVVAPDGELLPMRLVYACSLSPLINVDLVDSNQAKKVLKRLGFELIQKEFWTGTKPRARGAFWWVNHKQTFKSEFDGGYVWSPKKNANGARNQTYDNLTLVQPGDIVVSYAGGIIKALGVATSNHFEATKPAEFGNAGAGWSNLGWMVPVDWVELAAPIRPKDHLADIQRLLPAKNSPLQANGNGNQGCYLASISSELGRFFIELAESNQPEQIGILQAISTSAKEDAVEIAIDSSSIPETEKLQLVRARRGQGIFRERVAAVERQCRLTGVEDQSFLIASHIKPWRDCDNSERLDGSNGLMLAPHVDRLFDRGWITFEDDGVLLVSQPAKVILEAWKINTISNVGSFTEAQQFYLAYHRSEVFKS